EMKDRREEYVKQVCEQMIPAVAQEKLARFADVFCEKGVFTVEDTRRVFEAAAKAGLSPRVHEEQPSRSGSAALTVDAAPASAVNGAWALGLGKTLGSLEPGKQADLVCYDAKDYREIPYYFGASQAVWVVKKGAIVHSRENTAL